MYSDAGGFLSINIKECASPYSKKFRDKVEIIGSPPLEKSPLTGALKFHAEKN